MTVLIDSWAWMEFYAGSKAGEKVMTYVVDDDQDVIISAINLAEIYQVALRSFDEKTAETRRRALKNRCDIIAVDEEIAVMAAKIKHDLKWGLGDALIYATAKREGAKVLTGDLHFKGLSDVIYLGT
ncbi:MAG TPA: type II toxin-antitoxin system VapC family toxin [Methanotrichaceae archaeon]|nr:type II toxin-antitoxin system VapC family toxin [Methanotrichaceae archaeon]